ncbi:MAG: hypothetical protein K2P74_04810 [Nitrosomonas sp.]|nr:hypothetical protein [Nitrosomonas sp.]
MTGLITELQADALNKNVNVSDLLRKALVVSIKLGINQIEEWLKKELNGYSDTDDIPSYRTVYGQAKAYNPYRGWLPIQFADHEMASMVSQRELSQAIGELDLLNLKDDGHITAPFSHRNKQRLMDAMSYPLEPTLFVPQTEITKILEAVRNNILEWSLELESKGILGEGMSFSSKEKIAASEHHYIITNNIGSMQNSQFQQSSPNAIQVLKINNNLTELVQLLRDIQESINKLDLSPSSIEELQAEISTIESQAKSPKPKNKILSEALISIRTILEGATGNVLASGFLDKVTSMLNLL